MGDNAPAIRRGFAPEELEKEHLLPIEWGEYLSWE
jgi:hypothetical protein